MAEVAINLNEGFFESLFPKRFSTQKIISDLMKDVNYDDIKVKSQDSTPLSDELQIWDIDLKTFDLKSLHKDGYYIDEKCEVRKLSDHAIAYLRAAYPDKKIAENRVLGKKENLYESISARDIENIDIKNIHKDGYYIYADGSVERLSDEYIISLRKMFNDNSIASNRIISESINTINLFLVKDDSVKRMDFSKEVKSFGNNVASEVKAIGGNFSKVTVKVPGMIAEKKNDFVKNFKLYCNKAIKKFVMVKNKINVEIVVPKIHVKDNVVKISNVVKEKVENLNLDGKIKLLGTRCLDGMKLIKNMSSVNINKYCDDVIVRKAVSRPEINISGKVKTFGKKCLSKFNLVKKDFVNVLGVNINKYEDNVTVKPKLNVSSKIKEFGEKFKLIKNNIATAFINVSQKKDIISDSAISNLKLFSNSIVKKMLLVKNKVRKMSIKSFSSLNVGSVAVEKPVSFDGAKDLSVNLDKFRDSIKKRFELIRESIEEHKYIRKNRAKKTNIFKGLYRFATTANFAHKPIRITAESLYEQLGGNSVVDNNKQHIFVRLYNIANSPKYGRKKDRTFISEIKDDVKNYNNDNKKLFKVIKGEGYSVPRFNAFKVLGNRLISGGASLAVAAIALTVNLTTAKADGYADEKNVIMYSREDNSSEMVFNVEKTPALRGCKILLNDEVFDEKDEYDKDPLSYYELDIDDDLFISKPVSEEKTVEENLTLDIEKPVIENKKLYYNEYDVEPKYTYLNENDLDIEGIIRKYCNIYNVNYDEVYSVLFNLTDNFTNDDFVNKLTISGVTCKGKPVYASSYEELLLLAVRSIAQKPTNFKVNSSRLYHCDAYYSDENKYEEQISHISKIFNLDRCLIYAIIYTETNFTSDLFKLRNNPAGLMDQAQYVSFSSKEEGFIELCTEVRKYNDRGAYTLEEMAEIHCKGNPKWAPVVREVYERTKANEKSIFGEELVQQKTLNR